MSDSPRREQAVVALGSNLGDRLDNLRAAVAALRTTDGVDVRDVSPLYETAPVGGPDGQGPFLNAALVADTTLAPGDLLARLHEIEASRERRREVHWGPRTLDLDLLVHGDVVVAADPGTNELEVPHPRLHERRFVLVPVCDIAPDLVHPVLGATMRDLLAALPVEPGDLTVVDDPAWHTTLPATSEASR